MPVTGREAQPSFASLCMGPWDVFEQWGFSGCHARLELFGWGMDADTMFWSAQIGSRCVGKL